MDDPRASVSQSANDDVNVEIPPSWVRVSIVLILVITLLLCPLIVAVLLWQSGDLVPIAKSHAQAMIGVPWAGGAAFIVVLVLRTSFGAINFKILGTEFSGASGPIIMWVLCFLAETSAIKLLW